MYLFPTLQLFFLFFLSFAQFACLCILLIYIYICLYFLLFVLAFRVVLTCALLYSSLPLNPHCSIPITITKFLSSLLLLQNLKNPLSETCCTLSDTETWSLVFVILLCYFCGFFSRHCFGSSFPAVFIFVCLTFLSCCFVSTILEDIYKIPA